MEVMKVAETKAVVGTNSVLSGGGEEGGGRSGGGGIRGGRGGGRGGRGRGGGGNQGSGGGPGGVKRKREDENEDVEPHHGMNATSDPGSDWRSGSHVTSDACPREDDTQLLLDSEAREFEEDMETASHILLSSVTCDVHMRLKP